ncbi:SrfA family protein [Azospirillum sp. B506]|uniref:SrfA family protein n=1 Tax=Azospirillum sp. B506 TaxID=137721 RepID=UPI001B3BEA7B|nr:SrfA family protein [Azospirillum sp. B506]
MPTAMRPGALLVTDTVDRYQPLGAFGQPVYLSYVQLKAAVRQKLGVRCANYFSRPDRDPQGRAIRWLSDVPGTAVRWRDLPHDRQVAVAMDLYEMRSAFQKYLGDLRGQPGAPREAAAFASLLENALLVPDDEHLYLVDDQPMVSFWGFRHGEGAGFDALTVGPAAPAPAPATPAAPAAVATAATVPAAALPGIAWWKWLLGLLALLLLLGALLFALRGWWPFGLSLPGLSLPGIESPVAPGTGPGVTLPDARRPDAAVEVPTPNPGPGTAVPALPAPAVPTPAVPAVPDRVPTPAPVPPVPSAEPPATQLPPPVPPPAKLEPKQEPKPEAKQEPKPVPVPDSALRPPVPGAEPPTLSIPPDADRSGSVAFLEGWWRSRNGLVNKQDKAPLQQLYRFDDKGKGEVVLRRADGSECRAPAQAVLGPNGLDVTELSDPVCADGTKFGRSRTSCHRDKSGLTQCFGINDDNSTYRIPVERLP